MNREERDFRLARVREKKAELKKSIEEFYQKEKKKHLELERQEAARVAKEREASRTWWGRTKKVAKTLDPFSMIGDDISTGFDIFAGLAKLPLLGAMHEQYEALEEEEARLLGTPLDDTMKSEEDVKMAAAKERFKRDIRFKVDLSAGKKLYAHEALQQWKRDERNRIIDDESLTASERKKVFDALEEAYNEEEKRIRTDSAIYEEY